MKTFFSALVALAVFSFWLEAAHAASACPAADRADRLKSTYSGYLARLSKGECSYVSSTVQALRGHNDAVDEAVRNCKGYTYKTRPNPDYAAIERELADLCRIAGRQSAPRTRDDEPANGIKPDASPATQYCSSLELGDKKACITIVKSRGGYQQYSAVVSPMCQGFFLVAFAAYDVDGTCKRNVTSVSNGASADIISFKNPPYVLDAIAWTRKSGVLQCYRKRHVGGSC